VNAGRALLCGIVWDFQRIRETENHRATDLIGQVNTAYVEVFFTVPSQ